MTDLMLVACYLRGASFRELDAKCGNDPKETNGKLAWRRVRKFFLTTHDRGRLFAFSDTEARGISSRILAAKSRRRVLAILRSAWPRRLNRFKSIEMVAPSPTALHRAITGEVRNLTHGRFTPERKRRGTCQYAGCLRTGVLHTAHVRVDRPAMFVRVAAQHASPLPDGRMKFDVGTILRAYIEAHRRRRSVAFLCAGHHRMQESAAKKGRKIREAFMGRVQW